MIEVGVVNNETLSAPTAEIKEQAQKSNIALDFDPDALKAKYIAEKEKRSKNGGLEQYQLVREHASLLKFVDDPYVKPGFTREPVKHLYDVVVIGGGFTGVQVGACLMGQGITNFCIIEKGGDYGGTWYWNRYPGAQCDIESYIYMPLIEEMGVMPTEKYARGPELQRHARAIADRYSLEDHTLFQTIVKRLVWNDTTATWKIETSRDDEIEARWVVQAPGPLHTPKFPGVPGIELFKGKSFHSCRWDYSYSGGTPENPELTKLRDKRVGIVGTGATAIQIVPRVAEWAKDLYVFQRTPSSVDVRGNRPTDPEWAKSLTAGWQKYRMENFATLVCGGHADEDLVADGWTDILRSLAGFYGTGSDADDPQALAVKMQLADFKKMESIRHRVDSLVKDPKTAEGLKPWYNQFCKRPCFHDEYLQAFNNPNVHLVHTDGKGIDRVTEHGIVANGEEIELDCIIYATGFEFAGDFCGRFGVEIVGRGGQTLSEKWKDGASTYHGWSIHGFPNLMTLTPLQSGSIPNFTHNVVFMMPHLIYLMEQFKKRHIKSIEPSVEAEAAWVAETVELGKSRGDFLKECTPGYLNDEGVVNEVTLRNQPYGGGAPKFNQMLREWREADRMEGMLITYENESDENGTSSNSTNGNLQSHPPTSTTVQVASA
ncbi:hypothetical protein Z517_04128 [Fonsecaea pedrosoi CBS 271.37]|uniref:FAD/NAD(P)-binding domain-containing protein n=1 Tax=Fonsecaea pedrosoi CBS 271.37 TaxID=1442368 RepID=A0A0D2GRB6_9EURO|nr:uncharacterized protein Z517_04128 [Fonsecaea pedrosoi CBS 271.37]KIW81105.1 hypothetical protein Z517_04128 [Fonsecaea pedrosoi CBS 271.37]